MHDILGKIDDLDATIGASTDFSHNCKQAGRRLLGTLAQDIAADIGVPRPGSTTALAGATITHRPDLAYAETALRKADAAGHGGFAGHRPASIQGEQAAMQGHADRGGYLPAQRAILDGAGDAAMQAARLEDGRVLDGIAGPNTHVMAGNAGTIQAPAPLQAAESAKIGTTIR